MTVFLKIVGRFCQNVSAETIVTEIKKKRTFQLKENCKQKEKLRKMKPNAIDADTSAINDSSNTHLL